MDRLGLATALLLLGVTAAPAQDWAKAKLEQSPRHGEWVTITHGDRQVKAFVVYPEVKERATAVIVIHEIFGLTDWVRTVADDLAAAGHIAIAPDLLSGTGPNGGGTESYSGETVRRAISALPPEQIIADLKATRAYVEALPAANGKVAVCGFCWGGGQVLRYAAKDDKLKAAMAFYGSGPATAAEFAGLKAPVYGFYGGNDARVNATIPKTTELLKSLGKTYEPVTYDGAGHGFMRAGAAPDASPVNNKAMQEAWARVKSILAKL